MTKKTQLHPSGIPLVDLAWGGLYRGGTYFLIGPRKSGRTLLSLQYAYKCAQRKEVCIFFTTLRPKDLLIHAASIDFDLQHYMNQDLVIVVRVTPPEGLSEVEDHDTYLAEYIQDIIPVIEHYKPSKMVFDELTPFINFQNVEYLKKVFSKTVEQIEDEGITSLFTIGEPANSASVYIVDTLSKSSTGIITLEKSNGDEDSFFEGKMSIISHIGHTEGNFSADYYVDPDKGITVEYTPPVKAETDEEIKRDEKSERFDTISDFDIPSETISYSGVYSLDDFQLLLNNQIAMYQITGQLFKLVAIWLDESAENHKLLNLHQLRNTVRISTDKKDKLCMIGNKIFVIIPKPTKSSVVNLVSKIKTNLPEDDPNTLQKISRLISIYSIDVSGEVQNAEGMIAKILKETSDNA
ncbi:MAG: ATPase domain-containing protein [Ignavibacteria bacterium]|jgi:circadian clock protein KaiC